MTSEITSSFVILSEGTADKNFLKEICKKRMPQYSFDFPFPNDRLHSCGMFGRMLDAIQLDRPGFAGLKGIIIVADSGDDPKQVFSDIVRQIREVGGFVPPPELNDVQLSSGPLPDIAITTLPSASDTGGLETLLYKDIVRRHPDVSKLVDEFLRRHPIEVMNWNAEKQGKAHYAASVAATHQDDPSRAASYVFRDPPTIDVDSPEFTPFVSTIETFCSKLLTTT